MMKTLATLVSRLADGIVKLTGMRRDWALHLLAGIPCAAYGAGLGWLAAIAQLNMVAACTAVAGLTFALTKEIADYLCNLDAVARGEQPVHGVEVMDALFGVLASAVVAVVIQVRWN